VTAPTKLILFGIALVALFLASFTIAGAVVPDDVVTRWTERGATHDMDTTGTSTTITVHPNGHGS